MSKDSRTRPPSKGVLRRHLNSSISRYVELVGNELFAQIWLRYFAGDPNSLGLELARPPLIVEKEVREVAKLVVDIEYHMRAAFGAAMLEFLYQDVVIQAFQSGFASARSRKAAKAKWNALHQVIQEELETNRRLKAKELLARLEKKGLLRIGRGSYELRRSAEEPFGIEISKKSWDSIVSVQRKKVQKSR